jgi:hypothetical protein
MEKKYHDLNAEFLDTLEEIKLQMREKNQICAINLMVSLR